MKLLKELIVIIFISFTISLLVYLSLMPKELKPKTFKQFKLDNFLNQKAY